MEKLVHWFTDLVTSQRFVISFITSCAWVFFISLARAWYGRSPSDPRKEREKLIERIERTPLERHWRLAAKRGLRRSFVEKLVDRITGNVQPWK